MERKLGISIYPSSQSFKEMKEYIELAHKYGYTRIFSSLLEIEGDQKTTESKFKKIFKIAKELGFEICLDVNPKIFKALKINPIELSFFNKLFVDIVRLDNPLHPMIISEMTHNPYGIKIELNISLGTKFLDDINDYEPIWDRIIGCHNFYPQNKTGLTYDYFIKTSSYAKKMNIRTAAFVSSSVAKIGPWPVSDGIPTLEQHRNLPIDVQAKHLWATKFIDDILISNACASETELKLLSNLDRYKLEFNISLLKKTTPLEKKILFDHNHFRRGDLNEYTIRSSRTREIYSKESIKIHDNESEALKGNIYIGNDTFENYKGELQIALKNSEVDSRKNLVATINKEELFLLDYVNSWTRFKFKK